MQNINNTAALDWRDSERADRLSNVNKLDEKGRQCRLWIIQALRFAPLVRQDGLQKQQN